MNGKIYVIGIGPGDPEYMTPEARRALDEAEVIAGYGPYLDLLEGAVPAKRFIRTPMREEIERCRACLQEAQKGCTVALVCSGDPGVYGMASPILELAGEYGDIPIKIISGITAANSGAAVLGAPLANDYCVISLSDLLTPWEVIKKRLRAACDGDFVIALYNPSSSRRRERFLEAVEILCKLRGEETACGFVRNIGREGTEAHVLTLGELLNRQDIDMHCTVFIGNTATGITGGRLVTPRGYVI